MRRREAIKIVAAMVMLRPPAAVAQQTAPLHRIGVLAQNLQPGLLDAFRAGLLDLGYIDGQNIGIEVRNAAGRNERLAGLVNDLLLSRKVDVILAVNTPAAQAAKKATSVVPIVIMRVADP